MLDLTERPNLDNHHGMLENRATVEAIARLNGCPHPEYHWYTTTIPKKLPGIYVIWADLIWKNGKHVGFRLTYIGQSKNIKGRLTNAHKAYDEYGIAMIGLVLVADKEKRESMELHLVGYLNPPLNIIGRTDLTN